MNANKPSKNKNKIKKLIEKYHDTSKELPRWKIKLVKKNRKQIMYSIIDVYNRYLIGLFGSSGVYGSINYKLSFTTVAEAVGVINDLFLDDDLNLSIVEVIVTEQIKIIHPNVVNKMNPDTFAKFLAKAGDKRKALVNAFDVRDKAIAKANEDYKWSCNKIEAEM